MLNSRRWIPSVSLLITALGMAYWGCFQYLIHVHIGKSFFEQRIDPNFNTAFDLVCIAFLFILLYDRGQSFKDLGLSFTKQDLKDTVVLLLYLAAIYVILSVISYLNYFYFHFEIKGTNWYENQSTSPFQTAIIHSPFGGMMLYVATNAVVEELIIRAFLMTELNTWLRNGKIAVVASALIMTGYHLYQGWLRCIPVFLLFLLFSDYYQKSRRVTPLIIVHYLIDLFTISMMYLYAAKYGL